MGRLLRPMCTAKTFLIEETMLIYVGKHLLIFLIALAGHVAIFSNAPDANLSAVIQETDAVVSDDGKGLKLTAHWAPFTDSKYHFGTRWDTVRNLKPAQKVKSYSKNELAVFMPSDKTKFGEIWKVEIEKIIPILKQFHSGATQRLHHGGPQGAYGAIVAENDTHRRIRIRAHAQFDLKDGKYVPSQFAGDLVVNRSTGQIVALKLGVPPRRNNVDLNWETGKTRVIKGPDGKPVLGKDGKPLTYRGFSADIGYCKKLELTGGDWKLVDGMKWDRQLKSREVDKNFQKKFYRFAQIDWLPWEEAVAKSKKTGKPLHVVALFGALDDESC